MGIETLFFVSLAVIFILLVGLAYHFNSKLSIMDQRVNKVIEIVNSVVKEMGVLKSETRCLAYNGGGFQAPIPVYPPMPMQMQIPMNVSTEHINYQLSDLNSESESESDSNSDSNSESGSEYESEYSEDNDHIEKIVVSDNEEDVNLDVVPMDLDIPSESVDSLSLDASTIEVVELSSEQAESKPFEFEQSQQLQESIEALVETPSSATDVPAVSERKLSNCSVSELRQMAESRGIDAKKLKKAELIQLLEK